MKEFDDFTEAIKFQNSSVETFESAHDMLDKSTSNVATKGMALKKAIDDAVTSAGNSADSVKGDVSLPTLPPSGPPVASIDGAQDPAPSVSGGIPIPTVDQTVTNADPAPTVATT